MSSSAVAQTRRLFVAADPPDEAVAHLGAVVDRLEVSRANEPGRSTRLTARDRWHVTLAFLGDVPAARIEDASRALGRAAADHTAPIQVCFANGGTFGAGSLTVVWAGLGGEVPALRRLADAVRLELRRARVPFDHKGFRPHLTISRPGVRVEPALVAADVATLGAYVGPLWTVDALHLVASDIATTSTGPQPRYTRVASIPLV